MARSRNRRRSPLSGISVILILLLLLIVGGGFAAFFIFFEGDKPTLSLESTPDYFNKNGTIELSASDFGSGFKNVTVTATQNGKTVELYRKEFPRSGYTNPVGPLGFSESINFDTKASGFTDGKLEIIVTATDFSARNLLKGNSATSSKTVIIDSKPPKISLLHTEMYITPGSTGIVIYKVDDPSALHGVNFNDRFAQGFPIASMENTYISYFGLPHNTESLDNLKVIAQDQAGNKVSMPFQTRFKIPLKKKDNINISDGFLNKKIPEFEQSNPGMSGALIDKFLIANNKMRKANNQKIAKLCAAPSSNRMWEGKFYRMAGSPKAGFAEYRSYYYKNSIIDNQVHLGFDIASTKRAKVKAANHGIVIFSDYLGIYGKMVLIDHGQGVFSLYSHLSQLDAVVGSKVNKGDIIGLTGTSGMAGGDHLHFSMLIHGVFVTPKEWFDAKWIEDTIDGPLLDSKF